MLYILFTIYYIYNSQFEEFVEAGEWIQYKAGDVILEAGAENKFVYILVEGKGGASIDGNELGDISVGEGIYGLRRAFVIAGAESQLISLWNVSDQATKDLMVAYYGRLIKGEGRSEGAHQREPAAYEGGAAEADE